VLGEHVHMNDTKSTMASLIATHSDDDVFCKDWFTILLDVCSDDCRDSQRDWVGEESERNTYGLRL